MSTSSESDAQEQQEGLNSHSDEPPKLSAPASSSSSLASHSSSSDTSPVSSSSVEEGSQLEPLKFLYDLPYISQRKLATIQLVARYSILDPEQLKGRSFDFLSPEHSLHHLYQTFVKQYKLIIEGAKPAEGNVLRRAFQRAQAKAQTTSDGKSHTETGNGTDAKEEVDTDYMSIDWRDFVVLETVEFFSADINGSSQLSAPFTKGELLLKKQIDERVASKEPLFKSAITGELVPASQYNEHIRILTLNPSYEKQRAKEKERATNTNIDTENVAENLERLRAKRRRLLEEL